MISNLGGKKVEVYPFNPTFISYACTYHISLEFVISYSYHFFIYHACLFYPKLDLFNFNQIYIKVKKTYTGEYMLYRNIFYGRFNAINLKL